MKYIRIMKKVLVAIVALVSLTPVFVTAQEETTFAPTIYRAKVLDIVDDNSFFDESIDSYIIEQILQVEIIDKDKKGEQMEFVNTYFELQKGERFFLSVAYDPFTEQTYYLLSERDRTNTLTVLLLAFILTVVWFARKQGARSILGLLGSFLLITLVVLPALVQGAPPVWTVIGSGIVILFFAIIITHGFNRTSYIALGGTILTLIVTTLLAFIAVNSARISGFISEEVIYLNFNTFGNLDMQALILGGIIIGFLGVLDDIAITQVSVVQQLWHANENLSEGEVYKRAVHVGKDHMSSLVNTLVLAYTGAALPVLLLFQTFDSTFIEVINREEIAVEIIRMIIGSIGLILCVPLTTYLAVRFFKNKKASINLDETHVCGSCGHNH